LWLKMNGWRLFKGVGPKFVQVPGKYRGEKEYRGRLVRSGDVKVQTLCKRGKGREGYRINARSTRTQKKYSKGIIQS